jgi:hypothetical protein
MGKQYIVRKTLLATSHANFRRITHTIFKLLKFKI